ncbi:hypothetical protein [Streptomyces sp. 3214.6]|uniref:hypothetical protein n=1 Tax=Streptomyces sp. 3214.6 TaxID=1882757 RepID=UPI00090CDB2E|nr:hypothetical protein [Streptomyces sp. 3214.6]SHI51772.1 hypothetical protein SAMN05444521_7765 [Streptomyces sp. 3214.6]
MANNGQTDTAALVAMLSEHAAVNVRPALIADAPQWRLHHGQVTLDDAPLKERAWRYSTASFLELRLPGPTVAALLRGDDEQDVDGLHVVVPGPSASSASACRLRGQEEWGRVTTP